MQCTVFTTRGQSLLVKQAAGLRKMATASDNIIGVAKRHPATAERNSEEKQTAEPSYFHIQLCGNTNQVSESE